MDEVPGPQRPFLALHDQDPLAGQDEEVLLRLLAVVHARRLARLQDADVHPDLLEAAGSSPCSVCVSFASGTIVL